MIVHRESKVKSSPPAAISVEKKKKKKKKQETKVPKAPKPQCEGITEKRERCQKPANRDSRFCNIHDPASIQIRLKQQQEFVAAKETAEIRTYSETQWRACQRDIQEYQNTIKAQETIIRQNESKLIAMQKELTSLDGHLREQLRRCEVDIERLRTENSELHKEYTRCSQNAKDDRAQWETQRNVLQGKLRQQQLEYTKFVDTMQDRSGKAKQDMEDMKRRLDKASSQSLQYKNETKQYQTQVRAWEQKWQAREKEVNESSKTENIQKAIIGELQAQIMQLQDRIVQMETQSIPQPAPLQPSVVMDDTKWQEQIHFLERQLQTRDFELQAALSQIEQMHSVPS